MSKSFFPHLLNAFLNWNNEIHGKCELLVNLDDIDDPVLHAHKIAGTNAIIVNIGGNAIKNLHLLETEVRFDARFSGTPNHCAIPYRSIISIRGAEDIAYTLTYMSVQADGNFAVHHPPKHTVAPVPEPPKPDGNVVPLRKKTALTVVK